MDTDDKLTDEGMAGEDGGKATLPKMKAWKKLALLLVVLVLLLSAAGFFYINHWANSKTHIDVIGNNCIDNLRTIDWAVMSFQQENREYPTTIGELVGGYMKEIPEEPDGGYYYLDTSQTPPRAVCSKGHTY